MRLFAILDLGMGQVVLLLLVIVLFCGANQLPNLTRMLNQNQLPKEELRHEPKQLIQLLVIFLCALVAAGIVACVIDGAFGRWISALQK